MRTAFLIATLGVAALAFAHGCTLPLDGIPTEGSGGRGATSLTSAAGGAPASTTTGSPSSASSSVSTGPGPECMMDSQCPGSSTCNTAICTKGTCGFDTASHEATPCAPPASECFDASQCMAGACVPRPKSAGTVLDDGTAGNCTSLSCDGAGNSSKVADGSDTPPDNDTSDCQIPSCNGTTPTTKSKNNLDGCGSFPQYCWSGSCVNCVLDSQCPDSNDSCATPVCQFGKCKVSLAGDNTMCQISGGPKGKCASGSCCPGNGACGSACCGPGKQCMNGTCAN